MSEQGKMVDVRIGLTIERDDDAKVGEELWPVINVTPDPEDAALLHVLATNYDPSDAGARAVARTLETAAQAILDKLGDKTPPQPPRRGFNPRPAGPQTGSKA